MSDFGAALREIRLERGQTLEEMAEVLGTTKQVVWRYENGKRAPKVTVAYEYARKLGVPLSRLGGTDEPEEDDGVAALRETLRRRPGMRTLFDAAKDASDEDLLRAVAIIEALKGK